MLKPFGGENQLIPSPIPLLPGRYDFLQVRLVGVPGAIPIVPPVFTGELRIKKNGKTIINAPFNRFQQESDLLYGRPENNFVAATSFSQAIIIPCNPFGLTSNALDVQNASELIFEYDILQDPVSAIVSGVLELSGYQSFSSQRFGPLIGYASKVMSGHAVLDIALPNLTGLIMFLSAGAVAPNQVTIKRTMPDGSKLECAHDWANWLACSNMLARIEAAPETGVFVDLNPSKEFSEALSDSCQIDVVQGTGTFFVMGFGWNMEPARAEISAITVARELATRIEALPADVQAAAPSILGVEAPGGA
jgi:hypothetical protein